MRFPSRVAGGGPTRHRLSRAVYRPGATATTRAERLLADRRVSAPAASRPRGVVCAERSQRDTTTGKAVGPSLGSVDDGHHRRSRRQRRGRRSGDPLTCRPAADDGEPAPRTDLTWVRRRLRNRCGIEHLPAGLPGRSADRSARRIDDQPARRAGRVSGDAGPEAGEDRRWQMACQQALRAMPTSKETRDRRRPRAGPRPCRRAGGRRLTDGGRAAAGPR